MRKITELLRAAAGRTLRLERRRTHASGARAHQSAAGNGQGTGKTAAGLPFKRRLLLEAMEPRLLLSADLMPVATPPAVTALAAAPQAWIDARATAGAATAAPAAAPEVDLVVQAVVVDNRLPLSAVGPIEGGVRVASQQSGNLSTTPESAASSVSYTVDLAVGQLLSVVASVDNLGWSDFAGRLQVFGPDGSTVVGEAAGQSLLALQGLVAPTGGTYEIVLSVERLGGSSEVHPGALPWVLHAAVDALLETEDLSSQRVANDGIADAQWLEDFRVLPLPGAERTAVVGRLVPANDQGRTSTDLYAVTLAAGDTLEAISSLSSQSGYLQLLDSQGRQITSSVRVGENGDWTGPLGITHFIATAAGTYYLRSDLYWDPSRPSDPIDYTLVVARNVSLDPDSSDELGLAQAQLGAVTSQPQLESAGLGPQAAATQSVARFEATATAGTVRITLAPVADASLGETPWEPDLRAYDANGEPLGLLPAFTDTSMAWLLGTAVGARFSIEVAAGSGGQFLLTVDGAEGDNPAPTVTNSGFSDGRVAGSQRWQSLQFSEAVRSDLLQRPELFDADGNSLGLLTLYPYSNDAGASVELPANLAEGSYRLVLAAGALQDLTGQASQAMAFDFSVDNQLPTLVAQTPLDQGEIGGDQIVRLTFSEPMSRYWPGISAYDGSGQPANIGWQPNWSEDGRTLELQIYGAYGGDTYELRFDSWGLQDLAGNQYDANPATSAVDGLVLRFSTDADVLALPALAPREPLGALVYSSGRNAALASADDSDDFQIELQAGQTFDAVISAALGQATSTLPQVAMEVLDPSGNVVASGETSQAGRPLLLAGIAVDQGGTWTLRVWSPDGSQGSYNASVVVGADVQREGVELDGVVQPGNHTRDHAEDLDRTSRVLADGIDRLASVGRFSPGFDSSTGAVVSDWDFFRFTLDAGQTASIVVAVQGDQPVGNLRLALFDDSGDLASTSGLLVGASVAAADADRAILDFTNHGDTAVTLYARPRADTGARYTMVVTRGATFDVGTVLGGTQSLGPTGAVLGAFSGETSTGVVGGVAWLDGEPGNSLWAYDGTERLWTVGDRGQIVDPENGSGAFDAGNELLVDMNDGNGERWFQTIGGTVAEDGRTLALTAASVDDLQADRKVYVPAGDGFVRYLDQVTNHSDATRTVTLTLRSDMGADNGTRLVMTDADSSTWFDSADQWVVTDDYTGASGGLAVAHVLWGDGGLAPTSASLYGDNLERRWTLTLRPGETASLLHFAVQANGTGEAELSARRLVDLPSQALEGLSAAELASIVNFNTGSAENFRFWATEGDALTLSVQALNDDGLPLVLRVFDPAGNLVLDTGAPEGLLAGMSTGMVATASGAWTVQLLASGAVGEYLIEVDGATGAPPAPQVVASLPAADRPVSAAPASIDLSFDQFIRPDSVQASDLVLDDALSAAGISVSGVEVLSGTTLRFRLTAGSLPEGSFGWSMAANAVTGHDGQGNLGATGSFEVDRTGPQVLDHGSSSRRSNLGSLTFSFDQAVDPASLSLDDIASFTGPDGSNLRSTLWAISASGNQVTVNFQNQTAPGAYTLVLGPGIADLAGNAMDQDADGTPGEALDDRYTAVVTVADADLVVTEVTAPTEAVAGQPISLQWTVRNDGAEATLPGAIWYDRIRLVNDAGNEVYSTYQLRTQALAVGASYTQTLQLIIPLTAEIPAGNYQFEVVADGWNYLPEQNNSNNARRAPQPLALSQPAVADLVITDVDVPTQVGANTTFDISWQVLNQGDGPTSGGHGTLVELVDVDGNLVYVEEYYEGNFPYRYPAYQNSVWIYDPQLPGEAVTQTMSIQLPWLVQPGDYRLRITADYGGNVPELAGESNNATLSNVFSLERPNLRVNAVTVSTPVTMGQSITVSWEVRNDGQAPLDGAYGYDQVQFIDADTGDVAYSLEFWYDNYLQPGATSTRSQSFEVPFIPELANGNYRVRVNSDVYNYIAESNETDNSADAVDLVTVVVPALPDLVASEITVPDSVAGNTTLTINWSTVNQGSAATDRSFYDYLYLENAAGNVVSNLGSVWHSGVIAASGSVQRSASFTVPHTVPPGSYRVRIDTDVYNYISELLGEDNNSSHSVEFNVTTALVADLVVQQVTAPSSIVLGQPITVTWSGQNLGNAATPSSWYDMVDLVDATGVVRLSQARWVNSALPAGSSYEASLTFTPPVSASIPEGTYSVRIRGDVYGYLNESNEANNALSTAADITLTAPATADLVVEAIQVPAEAAPANTRITLVWDEVNQGDAASTNGSNSVVELINANGSRVYIQTVSFSQPAGLAVGQRVQRSFELVLPASLAAGNYRARITTDSSNQVVEYTGESNNVTTSAAFAVSEAIRADLTNVRVTSTLPAELVFGSTLQVDYTVDNSGPGSTQNVTWTDRVRVVRVSDGAVVVTANVAAGSASGIPAGGSYSRSASLSLPITGNFGAGAYRLEVLTDVNANLNESDRTDNNLQADLALTVPPLANLVAADVSVTPAPATAGMGITVSWTSRNTGDGPTLPRHGAGYNYFHDRVYLADSNGVVLQQLGEFVLQTPLAAGDSIARVQQLTLPDNLTEGNYTIVVQTDIYDYINEHAGESDNRGISAAFAVTQPPRVDLQAAALVLPAAEAATGTALSLQWVTRNAGQADFAGSFNEVVQISTSADFSTNVRSLAPLSRFTGTIASGGEVQRSTEVLVPLDLNGPDTISRTWYVRVVSDNNNEVFEYSLEGNNASAPVAIVFTRPALPDLQVDAVDAPAAAVAGQAVVVTYTVTNHGTAEAGMRTDRISLLRQDGSLWTLEQLVRSEVPLAAGASQQLQARFELPLNSGITGFAGSLRAQVTTDVNGEVAEYPNDSNNTRTDGELLMVSLPPLPDLVLSGINLPDEALTEATIPVRWTVTNSGAAATTSGWTDRIWLTRSGTIDGNSRLLGDFSIDTTLAAGASLERVQTVTLPRDTTGTWKLVVVTDVGSTIFEGPTGEQGNQRADDGSLTVLQRPLPNLVVSSVTPPQNAFSSQQAIVRWTVANTGDGATTVPLWRDAVYLSTDDVLDGSDTWLGSAENPGFLEVGGAYANQLTVTLPRGISGAYRFLVVADVNNQLYEGNPSSAGERDNTSSPALAQITLTPPPDLVVSDIGAPLQVFSGEPITVTWTVLNDDPDGRTRETGWYDRVWLSADTTLDNGDLRLGDVWHAGALDPLESYNGTLTTALPIGMTGRFHVIVATDIGGQVFESTRELNNTRVRDTATEVLLTPPPDLEIVDVNLPESVRAGTTATLSFRVENLGASDVPARQPWWNDSAWLSLDDVIDSGDIALGSVSHYGALPVDGGYDATLNFTLPVDLPERADYRVILRTDSGSHVFEGATGDANNTVVLGPLTVFQRRPDLLVTDFSIPSTAEAGRTAPFQWTVRNQGDGDTIGASWTDSLWVSLDSEIGDGDDVLIGNVSHAGVLAPGASYTVNVAPVLPFAIEGTSRFYVRTDGGSQVVEASEANNVSLVQTLQVERTESDLQVTDAVVTPVAGDSRSFDLRFVVTNNGEATTHVNAWADGVWLSANTTIGAGDIRVATTNRGNPLAAGESYTVATRITVPASVPAGSFKVLVRADDDNRVIEGDHEDNNTAVAAVTLGGLPVPAGDLPVGDAVVLRPDLTIVSVDTPSTAISGQSVTIRWTSRNQGSDAAGNGSWWFNAYDQVYLSEDAFLDSADQSLGFAAFSGQAAGADAERSLTANLPVGRSGLFYVLVKADASNRVAEPDAEGNNIGLSATLLRIDPAPPADLVAGTVEVPADAVLGAQMAVTYSVSNQSSFDALGSWRDMLYLSTDDQFDTGDIFFGAVDVSGPVAGGSSYSRTVQARLPGVDPGAYRLIVRSDARNMITEQSEANNLSASIDAVELDVPELSLGQEVGGNFVGGAPLYYKVRVAAGEALRFTLDGPGDDVAHDMFVGFNSVPTRSQNLAGTSELFTPDPVVTIPSTEAGVYYLRIDPSPQGSGSFSLRADLVPFSLDRVRETSIGNTGEATVRVDGTLFTDATVFELVGADGQVYRAVETTLKDAGRAYVTFDLFGATAGSYTLRALRDTAAGDTLTATLATPMQVVDGVGADAFLTITGPTAVQVNRNATFTLNYSNDGDADTLAPLLIVTPSAGTTVGLSANALSAAPLFILGTAQDGPLDLLRPGARYSTEVAYRTPGEAGFLSIEARPVQADSSEQITNWSLIEGSLRPAGVDVAAWQTFWARVQPRIGNTLGDLVSLLNDMAVRLSPPGDPIRDVRALFAAQFAADAQWTPSQPVSGVLLGASSGAAQGGVEVQVASLQNGRLRVEASTISAADGSFSFSRVRPGEYFLIVGGRQFDLDRDGLPDQGAPTLTVSANAAPLVDTLYLIDAGLGTEINREDSRTQLLTDTAGVVHAFWQRGDQLYHAYQDADGAWQDARPVSDGVPGEVAVAAGSNLLGDAEAGLIAVWSEGTDNDSELYYAVGRAVAGGGYEWSDPVRLTSNTIADVAPDVVIDGDGHAVITFLRRDFTIQDDSDVYYLVVDAHTAPLVWNDATTFSAAVLDDAALAALAASQGELEPQLSQTYRFGYSKDLGEWNIAGFYVKAGFEGTLVATLDDSACETTVGGQVKGFAEIKVANKGKVAGEGALYANAKWTVDPNTQDWKFAGANADFTGSVKYVWRDGIYDVMAAFPTLAPIAQLLRQGQNFINKASGGAVRIQNGINIGPLGVEFKGMRWSADAPFPNFFLPQTLDSAAVSGSLGLWARAYSSYWGGIDLSLEGSIGLKAQVYPSFKLEGNAQAAVTGKVGGWVIFNGEWQGSATLIEGSELSAQANDPAPLLMLRWDPEATLGSTNVYGTGAVDAQVAANRLGDSPMKLSRNADGSVSGLFARDGDAASGEIGTKLYVTDLGAGGWSDEVAIDGSLGFNGEGKLVSLADGRRVAVWTHASTAGLDSAATMDEIFAARDANDVYYAIDDGTGFGAAMRLVSTGGTDADLAVTALADGSVAVAWTSTAADGTATLMTTSIGGAGAGTVTEVASGLLSNVSMAASGAGLVLSWDLDTDASEDGTAFEVQTATVVDGTVTVGGFDVTPLNAEFAKVIGLTSQADDGQLGAQSLFPPFAVPEDCKKCTPEKIKKLTEAAPDCRPGGGSETSFDAKKCEEKTITYAPCVTRPSDPNDIVGPTGYGDENWIKAADALPYTIRFENQASATAPAQVVTITQTLDADLDARSFRITGFGFADVRVQPTEIRSFYAGRLDLRETQGIYLDVAARIDTATREITWTLTTIDPATGDVPVDATLGFLLPNDDSGRGDGFVSYTVRPLRAVATGTTIDAQARIVFDSEGPIDTPAIFHTLDAGGPSSSVAALPESTDSSSFVVRWAGTDATGGSAIRDYEVYVSTDGGEWTLWQLATADTEAVFEGEPGHSYAFYSVARDNAGNVEAAPASADTSIRVMAQTGSISGTVFDDTDGDGLRGATEGVRAGVTVFIDADADGIFDAGELSVITDDTGNWLFADLDPQVVRIAVVAGDDQLVTSPLAGYHDAAVQAGDVLTGRDFGLLALGSIGGVQFDDVNGNGQRDAGEQGLAGWTIFIDADDDGQLDDGERSTLTLADGSYLFERLRPGAYTVAQVAQDGWLQTRPGTAAAGQTAFAVTLSGSLASISLPACACGGTITTVAAQQAGWDEQLVELDALRADPGFAGVDGSGVRVVVIDTGIDATHPFFDGRIVYQYDFADNDAVATDVNGHGTHVAGVIAGADAMFGGVAQGAELIVLKVFGNDGSGSFRSLERALQWVNNNAQAWNIGVVNLSLGDGGNWTDAGSRYGLGDEFAALAAQGIISVAASGNNYAGVNALGVAYPGSDPAVLAVGAVWTGDFGGPWKFGNGGVDEATGEDHVASFSQRDPDQIDTFAPGARLTSAAIGGGVRTMQGTSQSAAYVSGVAALAQQLAREQLGRSLTVAEFRELLVSTAVSINDGDDERDNVANSGLDYPRLDVKAMADAILAMAGTVTPPNDGGNDNGDTGGTPTPVDPSAGGNHLVVDLTAGEQVRDADFGVFQLGRVQGTVYADVNGNGVRDAGEAGIEGATVFVDANDNGSADEGETTVTTGAGGSWVLANLLPGSLTLRQAVPEGWEATSAASVSVSVTSGLDATVDFGRADLAPVAQDDTARTVQGRGISGQVLANDSDPGRPDNSLLTVTLVSGPARGSVALGADGAFTYTPEAGFEGNDSFTYAVSDGFSSREAVVRITVAHDVLVVDSLAGRHDGFEVVFSRPIATTGLDVGGALADVVVTDGAGKVVAGSLFVAADGRSARFLASGGVLADGSYSVLLRAGQVALRDLDGVALNGDADVNNGRDHVAQFTVARNSAVSVGLVDTARGPGQKLGTGASDNGLAVVLSQAAGVTEVRFTLAYDPALLGVATLARGSGLPAGASFSATELAPGRLSVVITSATSLPTGALTLAVLNATVASGAAYGTAQVIDVRDLQVNGGAIAALDDDGVHLAAFSGDMNLDRRQSSADVTLMNSLLAGSIARLEGLPLVDAGLLGDVNGSGRFDAVDPMRLTQALSGTAGLVAPIPGAPPVTVTPPPVVVVPPRPVPTKPVPRVAPTPAWVTPLVTPSATISANVSIRVTL